MATTSESDLLPAGGCGAEQATNKPVQEKKHHLQGGYECIFVKAPPDHLQTECPICLCVLKEPYLIDCCGNSFCKTCIEPIKAESKPCPLCNTHFATCIPDKRLQRTLNELHVYCCHKERGCEWVGELGSLPQHLNLRPQDKGNRFWGCQLVSIRCTFCSDNIQRKDLMEHEQNKCLQRPYSCEYCEEYESTFNDVTANHWPVCLSRPVPCPNNCGMSPKLEVLDGHFENECPLQVIDCAFKYAGCKEKVPRKDMQDHIVQNLALHMSLQATSHQNELKKLNDRISELELQLKKAADLQSKSEAEIAELRKDQLLQEQLDQECTKKLNSRISDLETQIQLLEVKNRFLQENLNQECKDRVETAVQEIRYAREQRLRGHLGNLRGELKKTQNETKQEIIKHMESEIAVICNHVGLVPVSFTLPGFQQKKSSNSIWYSPSFYTHPRGYKMCLRVNANGSGDHKNTHVSVFLYMMQGEYDESMKWPFQGDITVQLLNQVGVGKNHVLDFSITGEAKFEQVVSEKLSSNGWGISEFITHSNLLPSYLKDDCLKFCIKEVKLSS